MNAALTFALILALTALPFLHHGLTTATDRTLTTGAALAGTAAVVAGATFAATTLL